MEGAFRRAVDEAERLAKRVLPIGALRDHLVELHNRRLLHAGLRQFKSDPWGVLDAKKNLLGQLVRGWGNTNWAASSEYLRAAVEECAATSGPVLECGSGLSTIILGVVAQSMGREVWTLEHVDFWAEKVVDHVTRLGITSIHMCVKPLRDYGDYAWYDPPLDAMPRDFGLVVCDGPPGGVHGGRYGFLPVMRGFLASKYTILLDDTVRNEERMIARRWAESLGAGLEFRGDESAFVAIKTA